MKIIADGGSTKTAWCLINDRGRRIQYKSEGYNPYFVNSDYIARSVTEALYTRVDCPAVEEVHFYGAGCAPDKVYILAAALRSVFKNARVEVGSDMLAAARALLGDRPGFSAILGTGTNTCVYDGEQIVHSVNSLGYILGDEGSGCALGKKVLSDFIRGNMPSNTRQTFRTLYPFTADELISQIYSQPLANRFCANFCSFLSREDIDRDYAKSLVRESFREFFTKLVARYDNYRNFSFNCSGSVGFAFRSILTSVAAEYGMTVGKIIQAPIDELVNYHLHSTSSITD